jgi:hypothetical protein
MKLLPRRSVLAVAAVVDGRIDDPLKEDRVCGEIFRIGGCVAFPVGAGIRQSFGYASPTVRS